MGEPWVGRHAVLRRWSGLRQISSLFLSGLEAALQDLSILTDACAGCCGVRVCGARVRARVRERRYGTARRPAACIPQALARLPPRPNVTHSSNIRLRF